MNEKKKWLQVQYSVMWQYNVCGLLWENLQKHPLQSWCIFDLPALGKSTGRGEMSPKHQHWNSFTGKAVGKALRCFFCAKIWAPLHPWCPGTDLSVTECATWEASVLTPGSSAHVFHWKLKTLLLILHDSPQVLKGPQLSQPLCFSWVVCSPRRGQEESTKDYCKQQNYLPAASSMFSRDLLQHHLSPFPDHVCACRRPLQGGRRHSSCWVFYLFSHLQGMQQAA